MIAIKEENDEMTAQIIIIVPVSRSNFFRPCVLVCHFIRLAKRFSAPISYSRLFYFVINDELYLFSSMAIMRFNSVLLKTAVCYIILQVNMLESQFALAFSRSTNSFSRALTHGVSLNSHRRTALVTGSTDGIGLTTAKNLAAKGYNVILHGRDKVRIQGALETVTAFVSQQSSEDNIPDLYTIHADISTLNGCHSFLRQVNQLFDEASPSHLHSLDILLHNAGVFEPDHVLTEDGLEMTFAVNVMAPFVITSHLLSRLLPKDSSESHSSTLPKRIVVTSSISQCGPMGDSEWKDLQCHERPYSTHRAYSESKYMDALLAAEVAERLERKGWGGIDRITCNSLDPGTVNTKMLLAGWGPCGIDVESALGKI